jgi:hypothetical protein
VVGYNCHCSVFPLRRRFSESRQSSHWHKTCTLHSLRPGLVRGPVLSHGTHRPRPSCESCPSRSGARQATPRRFHSGTEPFGSTPWRRPGCDGWIHDPIRCLMGARQHPRYSPYALLITIGIEACAKHPLRVYVRMRKTPCNNGSRSGSTVAVMYEIHMRTTDCT